MTATVKVWREHRCLRAHRSAAEFLKCALPHATIYGGGEFAVVSWCNTPSVSLHKNLEGAEHDKRWLDRVGCGRHCYQRHELVEIRRS